MVVVRAAGWLLLLAGFLILGRDILAWQATARFTPYTLYVVWFEIHRDSLSEIESSLASWMLDAFRAVLGLWAAPVLVVAGGVIAWFGRKQPFAAARAIRSPS